VSVKQHVQHIFIWLWSVHHCNPFQYTSNRQH